MSGSQSAMSLPSVVSGLPSCWGSLLGSSAPSCCGLDVGYPLTGLAILALGRQQCQLLTQAAIVAATTTPLAKLQCQPIIILLPQWSTLGNPLHLFNPMTLSPLQEKCWCHSRRGHWSGLLSPSTLSGLQNTAFLQFIGYDKLEYYTHSL